MRAWGMLDSRFNHYRWGVQPPFPPADSVGVKDDGLCAKDYEDSRGAERSRAL